jgi:hypothetical protein
MVSYKKKSIKIAFTFASGCRLSISLRISSTHQMLHPVSHQQPYVWHNFDSLTSKLKLPWMTALDNPLLTYGMVEQRTVHQTAQGVQDLGHPVVRKHGDFINIVKLAIISAVKACP